MRLPIRSAPSKGSALAARGRDLAKAGEFMDKFKTILSDPYDPDRNPEGFINMGVSENYIMLEEIAGFVNKHIQLEPKDFSYGEGPWGSQRLRKAMAKFITHRFHPGIPVDPEHLLFANGVTALCEMLALSICDAGDGLLLSRPIYQAFKNDFGISAKVNCVFVDFDGVDQFATEALEKYEEALKQAEQEGIPIRGLVLCHPHNPLGQCYPRKTLVAFMQFCSKHQIHLIVDEIYALSVYDIPDPHAVQFESILAIDHEQYIDSNYLHLLYGMSKDTAASGIRIGVLYTRNAELYHALGAISPFHWSGSANEQVAILMLEDEKWMDGFLRLSRERLAARNKLVRSILDNEGVAYHKGANAGFFIWADFRPFLDAPSGAGVEERWAAEDRLMQRLMERKVFVTSGREMSAEEPGWFRIIYSHDEKVITEGLRRTMQAARARPDPLVSHTPDGYQRLEKI